MKFLVLATCLSVSAAQGFFGLVGHPNGAVVPVDEPRVAAARADHLATKFGQGVGYAAAAPVIAAPAFAAHAIAAPAIAAYGAGYGYAPYAAGYGYSGPLNLNTQLIAHPNGAVVPLDEPAVAAARADHLAAKGAIYAATAPVIAAPVIAAPVIAAPAIAAYGAGYGYAPYAAGYGYSGPLNLNTQLVAHPNGAVVPLDEPAVAAARADHFAAGGAAYAAAGHFLGAPAALGGVYAHAAPVAYGAGYASFAGLVAHPNGAVVPVDEPAVQAARADHFAAKGAIY